MKKGCGFVLWNTLDICTFMKLFGILHYEYNISHKILYVFQEFKGILDELRGFSSEKRRWICILSYPRHMHLFEMVCTFTLWYNISHKMIFQELRGFSSEKRSGFIFWVILDIYTFLKSFGLLHNENIIYKFVLYMLIYLLLYDLPHN